MATYTSTYTGEEIDSNIKKFFDSLSTVTVVTEHGATVTMSKGNTILYSKEDNGRYVFHPLEFGVWDITVSKGQSSVTISLDNDDPSDPSYDPSLSPIYNIGLRTVVVNLT